MFNCQYIIKRLLQMECCKVVAPSPTQMRSSNEKRWPYAQVDSMNILFRLQLTNRNWNSSHSLLVTWWWCAKMLCQQMELMIDVPRENVLGTFTKDRYYNIQGTWGNIQYFTSSFRIVQCYPNIYKYIYLALMLWSSQHNPSEKYPENIFRLTLILFTHLALCLQLKKLRDYSRHILYLYQTLKSSCFQHS